MKSSIADRIKITKTGKVLRRPMGIGHNKSKKSGQKNQAKRGRLEMNASDAKMIRKYF